MMTDNLIGTIFYLSIDFTVLSVKCWSSVKAEVYLFLTYIDSPYCVFLSFLGVTARYVDIQVFKWLLSAFLSVHSLLFIGFNELSAASFRGSESNLQMFA